MKMHRKTRFVGERTPAQRRPLAYPALHRLLARRQRLRKWVAMALAMFTSAGLLLAGLEF